MKLIECKTMWTKYNPNTRFITQNQLDNWNKSGYLKKR
jgi:hypothetical protein